MTPKRNERGSAALEAVIAIPAFLLFVALVIAAGRVAVARQAVQTAAAEAARQASIARSASEAIAKAQTGGQQTLADQGLQCVHAAVDLDTSGFAVPVGTPASVSATVTCQVDLSGIAIPGLPGSLTIESTVHSPLDTFRGR
ncbi:MAG: pilus assembly protein [Acidobacteriota bacterium]|nr:pilus assembly protein [Acidobacteriota bacterium]